MAPVRTPLRKAVDSTLAAPRRQPPTTLLLTVPGFLFHMCGMFLLPLIVALSAAMVFEVSEVAETLPALLAFTLVILFPITLAQLIGVVLKSREEILQATD